MNYKISALALAALLHSSSCMKTKQATQQDVNLSNRVVYSETTGSSLPGLGYFSQGVNLMAGKPLLEGGQANFPMFNWTYEAGYQTNGDTSYNVPDQMEIPAMYFTCKYADQTTEIMNANTLQSMDAAASTMSSSYSNSGSDSWSFGLSASYSGLIYSASVDVNIASSSSYANSGSES